MDRLVYARLCLFVFRMGTIKGLVQGFSRTWKWTEVGVKTLRCLQSPVGGTGMRPFLPRVVTSLECGSPKHLLRRLLRFSKMQRHFVKSVRLREALPGWGWFRAGSSALPCLCFRILWPAADILPPTLPGYSATQQLLQYGTCL